MGEHALTLVPISSRASPLARFLYLVPLCCCDARSEVIENTLLGELWKRLEKGEFHNTEGALFYMFTRTERRERDGPTGQLSRPTVVAETVETKTRLDAGRPETGKTSVNTRDCLKRGAQPRLSTLG